MKVIVRHISRVTFIILVIRLLQYLKRTKPEEYYDLLGKLKIRDIK